MQNEQIDALLKRVFMFLEDSEWEKAIEYCERVLDMNPECGEAYLGRLMVAFKVNKREDLAACREPFEENPYFLKARRYGDENLNKFLDDCIEQINERNKRESMEKTYNDALGLFGEAERGKDLHIYEQAISEFEKILEWRDAEAQIQICRERIAEMNARKETEKNKRRDRRKKGKKFLVRFAVVICVGTVATQIFVKGVLPKIRYFRGVQLFEAGEYVEGYELLCRAGEEEEAKERMYDKGKQLLEEGDYDRAYWFMERGDAGEEANAHRYDRGMELLKRENYSEAYELLLQSGHDEVVSQSRQERARVLMEAEDYQTAYELLCKDSYEVSKQLAGECLFEMQMQEWSGGGTFKFGKYNGKEIEWEVKREEHGRYLLLSKYVLKLGAYTKSGYGSSWGESYLREWLNNDFLNEAFSSSHIALIADSVLVEYNSKTYDSVKRVWNQVETTDKVFVLSATEIEDYGIRVGGAKVTDDVARDYPGVFTNGDTSCSWWLRSNYKPDFGPGGHTVMLYQYAGMKYYSRAWGGCDVYDECCGIRPAIWIELE